MVLRCFRTPQEEMGSAPDVTGREQILSNSVRPSSGTPHASYVLGAAFAKPAVVRDLWVMIKMRTKSLHNCVYAGSLPRS